MRYSVAVAAASVVLLPLLPGTSSGQEPKAAVSKEGQLELGVVHRETLSPGTVHMWHVRLQADDYAYVAVEQMGVDLAVRLLDPDGETRREQDTYSNTGSYGPEKTSWIADVEGDWTIELVHPEGLPAGEYQIEPVANRPATTVERRLVEADSLSAVANVIAGIGAHPDQARELFERALAIREVAVGVDDELVGETLFYLARVLLNQELLDEAERLFAQSVGIREAALGSDHPLVAESLTGLGATHFRQGEYDKALVPLERALAVLEATVGPEHPYFAETLNWLAAVHQWQGRLAVAEGEQERALEIQRATLGAGHPVVVGSLAVLAGIYSQQGRYADASGLYEQELARQEAALGPEHPALAQSLETLGVAYEKQGRYADAVEVHQRALSIYEATWGPADPVVARSLHNLAAVYLAQGSYLKAESLFKRSLGILEVSYGPDHPEVTGPLIRLAQLYHTLGRYTEALHLYERALTICQTVYGPDHPDVALTLNNLALLYDDQGRYAKAEAMYERALAIVRAAMGPEHPWVASGLSNLAGLYLTQGRYAEAEPLYQQALRIDETVLGSSHPSFATHLNNLAVLYDSQGRYAEAEPLYERALSIRETRFEPDHPLVANSLGNLAVLYGNQGRYAEAEPLHKRALEINETVLGSNHRSLATDLNNLAAFYSQGRYAEAEPLYERALSIRETVLGPDHPDVGLTLNNLAVLYEAQERWEEAKLLLDRSVRIFDATTGMPDTRALAYASRARVRRELQDQAGALEDLTTALLQVEELRPQVGGGERTRADFLARYAADFERMVRWQLEAGDVEEAFEYAERGRARVLLDQLAAGKIDLRQSIPDGVREELESRESLAGAKLAEYQQRTTMMRGRRDLTDEERLAGISALDDSLRAADAEYRQVYEEIRNESLLWRDLLTSGGRPVPLATAQRRLISLDGVLLMYVMGSEESHVLLLPPMGEDPVALPLEIPEAAAGLLGVDEGPLTLGKLRQILTSEESDEPSADGWLGQRGLEEADDGAGSTAKLHGLFQVLVPDSISRQVLEASEFIVVPDGALHSVPFEALVVERGKDDEGVRFWLDEGPPVRYAPSTTVLYNIMQRPAAGQLSVSDVLSLSDPIYDPEEVALALSGVEGLEGPEVEEQEPLLVASSGVTRNEYERAGGALARLPGTALETEAILAAFGADRAMGDVAVLQGTGANEQQLRASLGEKRYVHLATHGLVDDRRGSLFAALAMTPPPAETSDPADDGFLQLYEIYDLQLPEVELAVLSACESNMGEQVTGEGVFALSRGFLAAGARRVIASQWSVNDASTAALMGAFFTAIAEAEQRGERVDYALALRDAKRELRNGPEWADPYYWAPFLLIGQR